ncbi:MAG: phenylacetate-CoA oxygenase subunit PaaI [Bacteroidota bacterium]|jgi:ring-1,2-phenylacetyl-CoA epoxidase subunit PaaC
MPAAPTEYLLHLADNALILGQRNAEWCGHGPVLEQDIAITNISLDLIGQARSLYQYAATKKNDGATEDSLAFHRTEREFRNILLVEQPIGDWACTVLRQCLFSCFQYLQYQHLLKQDDPTLAAISEKSLKEVTYHRRWSSEWVIRLGDGTDESHRRLEVALNEIWPYTGELFRPASYETDPAYNPSAFKQSWLETVRGILTEATLPFPPEDVFMHEGGKTGRHSEQMGFILTDLQYMQRTYPGCEW